MEITTVPEKQGLSEYETAKDVGQAFWKYLWKTGQDKERDIGQDGEGLPGEEGEDKEAGQSEENGAADKEGTSVESKEQDGQKDPAEENDNTEKEDMAKPPAQESEMIRVVLTGAEGIHHPGAVLQAGGETLEIKPDSSYFQDTNIIRVSIAGGKKGAITVASLEKACGHPCYEGTLEIRKEEDKLVLINEVPLETYVKGVLPSEMPSSYPAEALKAQAVCARTYAKMKLETPAYPEYNAAVDDSTACQVYGNIAPSEQGNQAADETAGIVILDGNHQFIDCYYYSTSCGRSAEASVWHGGEADAPTVQKSEEEITLMNQGFFDFIRETYESDAEYTESFYRWNYRCEKADHKKIFERCRSRQAVNDKLVQAEFNEKGNSTEITRENLGAITSMDIAERKEGGVADCLRISCKKGTVYVWGEYNIRFVLAQGGAVTRQDDAKFQVTELLPSAFLSLQSICNDKGNMVGYIAVGGGFGHGVGLSQNGAKHMALDGKDYLEILAAYYPGMEVWNVTEII